MKKNNKKKEMDNPFNPDYFSYRNDYPIEEIWNTDNALAQLIVPRLQAFKARLSARFQGYAGMEQCHSENDRCL